MKSILLLSASVSVNSAMLPTRRFVIFLEKMFPFRFLAAKVTRVPLVREIADRMLFKQTNLTVIPVESVVEINLEKSIKTPDSIVLPSQVVDYFIRKTNYRFIMNFCICREANHCKNHPIEFGCLFLGDAARGINPEFGREATVEEALTYVEKCRAEDLIHLIGRDKIDETWLGVGSDGKLLTICNCCSCCCLWKILPDLDPHIRSKVKRMPGVEVTVTERCIGCGTCTEHCFVRAIHIEQGHAIIGDDCKGCGRCADHCPQKAIRVTITDGQFLQKTIDRIESSVDVL
ncbi:MAG TPA: 4Fe-4S binding protein [Candidatus Thermoplasmatota archaeon]|nr:4Fe-4S binding protein [Candidatus Thermoplasmatota archaeon]